MFGRKMEVVDPTTEILDPTMETVDPTMEVVDPTREVVDARLLEGSSRFFAEIKFPKLLCVFQTRKDQTFI